MDNSSNVGRGNHIPADVLSQNQIDLLTEASFIQWVVLCTHPFKYLCLNKKAALKVKKLYDLLYSWYLRSRCFIIRKQSFGLSPSQPSFGISPNALLPTGKRCMRSRKTAAKETISLPLPWIYNPELKLLVLFL